MRRVARQRIGLLLTVTVLVAVVLWLGLRDYHSSPPALTELDADAITRIELVVAQGAPQIFVKRDGHWWRTAPTAMRGNDARLQRLADLAATPVARWAKQGEFDPARIGLSSPAATLTLDGMILRYGALSALDNLRYVEVGESVALVPRQDSPEIALALKPARNEPDSTSSR
ncbi:MAG: hypothetical protein ABIY40_09060 [Rhodanobacteraceae bacterium]|nr:DUF4340 domain-containing protein [Pseudomonadota bacterium]